MDIDTIKMNKYKDKTVEELTTLLSSDLENEDDYEIIESLIREKAKEKRAKKQIEKHINKEEKPDIKVLTEKTNLDEESVKDYAMELFYGQKLENQEKVFYILDSQRFIVVFREMYNKIVSFEQKLEEMQRQIDNKSIIPENIDSKEKDEKIAQIQNEKDKINEELTELREQIEKMSKEIENYQSESVSSEEVELLQEKIKEYEKELKDTVSKEKYNKIKEEKSEKYRKIKQENQDLIDNGREEDTEKIKSLNEELERTYKALKETVSIEQHNNTKEELNECRLELEECKSKIEEKDTENFNNKEKAVRLEDENTLLKEKVKSVEKEVEILKEELSSTGEDKQKSIISKEDIEEVESIDEEEEFDEIEEIQDDREKVKSNAKTIIIASVVLFVVLIGSFIGFMYYSGLQEMQKEKEKQIKQQNIENNYNIDSFEKNNQNDSNQEQVDMPNPFGERSVSENNNPANTVVDQPKNTETGNKKSKPQEEIQAPQGETKAKEENMIPDLFSDDVKSSKKAEETVKYYSENDIIAISKDTVFLNGEVRYKDKRYRKGDLFFGHKIVFINPSNKDVFLLNKQQDSESYGNTFKITTN